MTGRSPADRGRGHHGSKTAAGGTPFAVDVSADRRDRIAWVAFLAGPVLWFMHFVVVYLVAEAGCTGDGPGLELLDPPVPETVTLLATAVAVPACLAVAFWSHRRWRAATGDARPAGLPDLAAGDGSGRGTLAFAGMLLSVLSAIAVLAVGLPALFLPSC